MDLYKSSLSVFAVGHGAADALPHQLVASDFALAALRGVRVRAATANTEVVYVGSHGVAADNGYPLPAGEEVEIPIDDPSQVYVISPSAPNSSQSITLSGTSTAATFTLSFDGETTAPIAVTAAGSDVQAALAAVLGADFSVSGGAGGPYTVSFTGGLAGRDVPLMTAAGIGPNEQQTISVGGVAGDQLVLTLGSASTSPLAYNATPAQVQGALASLAGVGAGNVSVAAGTPSGWVVTFHGALAATAVPAITGVCGQNEQQTVTLSSSVTGGTFTLTFGSAVSAAIAYDATPAQVQTALSALPGIGDGNVSVAAGTPSGWVVTFQGTLANAAQALLAGTGTELVGTDKTVTVAETVQGDSAAVTVTETQSPHAAPSVAIANVANASDGSQYSWLSA